jgi:cobalt/nickel transport system permease protein
MAIAGSLVAYGVYRAIAANTPIDSKRRVVAAAAAGYISINCAALLAAIELGIQPGLYHDAAGSPLYAPYPLKIALPAMMIGHLAVAGIAEMILAAGVVAYLQRAEPQLLQSTAPVAATTTSRPEWKATRPLWGAVAILLIFTPLGILAAGRAWGEWSPIDFTTPQVRQQIAAASSNSPLPAVTPAGLEQLASFWTSPMPRYAPPFLHSATFGYMLSAAVGTGMVVLATLFAGWMLRTRVKL